MDTRRILDRQSVASVTSTPAPDHRGDVVAAGNACKTAMSAFATYGFLEIALERIDRCCAARIIAPPWY